MCKAYCTTEKKPLYQCIEKSSRHVVHLINNFKPNTDVIPSKLISLICFLNSWHPRSQKFKSMPQRNFNSFTALT